MPRSILGTAVGSHTGAQFGLTTPGRATLSGARLQQRLRHARTNAYVKAVHRLDVGEHHHDRAELEALMLAIASEFPELTIEQRPLGIVGECFLGPPYEVHICDLSGGIIEHFERHRAMPAPFEKGRTLAAHPSYAFIEIYADSIRAVSLDGSVAVINQTGSK